MEHLENALTQGTKIGRAFIKDLKTITNQLNADTIKDFNHRFRRIIGQCDLGSKEVVRAVSRYLQQAAQYSFGSTAINTDDYFEGLRIFLKTYLDLCGGKRNLHNDETIFDLKDIYFRMGPKLGESNQSMDCGRLILEYFSDYAEEIENTCRNLPNYVPIFRERLEVTQIIPQLKIWNWGDPDIDLFHLEIFLSTMSGGGQPNTQSGQLYSMYGYGHENGNCYRLNFSFKMKGSKTFSERFKSTV